MSVGKRKVYGSVFKAKVGLEAIRGVKTVKALFPPAFLPITPAAFAIPD